MEEIWRDIPGYEGIFMASTHGNVKRYARSWRSGRKGCRYKELPEGVVKQRLSATGYMLCNLSKDGVKLTKKVHQLVGVTFIDNPDNKKFINHIDGNKTNNNVENLEWVTAKENTRHAHDVLHIKERETFKLEDRINIYNKFINGCTVSELCDEYNTNYMYMYNLTVLRKRKNRKNFKVNRLSNG